MAEMAEAARRRVSAKTISIPGPEISGRILSSSLARTTRVLSGLRLRTVSRASLIIDLPRTVRQTLTSSGLSRLPSASARTRANKGFFITRCE